MSILKREVQFLNLPTTRAFMLGALFILVVFGAWADGFDTGRHVGRMDRTSASACGATSVKATYLAPPSGCGVSDPLACVTETLKAIVPADIEPMPAFTVVTTPTRIVKCDSAGRAYWACVGDRSCSVETLTTLADDLDICRSGHP